MATMLYQKQRAEISFAGSMTTILTWVTRSVKIGPGRLRTVNCRLFWTISQKMLAEQLGVSQAAISIRLHAMEKVQKIGKWVPHELNDRQMKRNTCQILLARQKRKSFLHRIVTGDEKWIYFRILKQEILGWSRLTINIFFKAKSLRTEDDAVRLGSEGCHLLRAVKTWWNC